MTLALRVYRRIEGEPALLGEHVLEGPRITIGRGVECTIVLEDPKKWVSRLHADLSAEAGALWLTVLSKVNPVFVNGERKAPGSRLVVQAGDRLAIGDYEIELEAFAPPEREPPMPQPGITFLRESVPELDFVLESADEVSGSEKPPERVEACVPAELQAKPEAKIPRPSVADEPQSLPQSTVDESETAAHSMPQPRQQPAGALRPGEDVVTAAPMAGTAPTVETFDEPTLIGQPADAAVTSVEESILLEVTQLRGNLPPPEPSLFETEAPAAEETGFGVPALDGQASSDSSVLEPTLLRTDGAIAAASVLERALNAFREGAGIGERSLGGVEETERFLRQGGALVRAAVEGVMALLVARAEAKKELRAEDRTMVASRDNNPLKLMADPQEAIEFLLDTKERPGGFLPPVQAVADAFEDVRAHEAALIAGMRAAVLGAIRRFDPKGLEEEFTRAGGFGLNRRAKLWDFFCALHQKLVREAEEDFNKAFGRDFIAAYSAQVARLRRK